MMSNISILTMQDHSFAIVTYFMDNSTTELKPVLIFVIKIYAHAKIANIFINDFH